MKCGLRLGESIASAFSILKFGCCGKEPHVFQALLETCGKMARVCLWIAVDCGNAEYHPILHGVVAHTITIRNSRAERQENRESGGDLACERQMKWFRNLSWVGQLSQFFWWSLQLQTLTGSIHRWSGLEQFSYCNLLYVPFKPPSIWGEMSNEQNKCTWVGIFVPGLWTF